MKIINVVGARPNFMKIAPITTAMENQDRLNPILVHTGQHYDAGMSDVFFRDLQIPQPDIFLNIGSDSHARQTAKIMIAFEEVLIREKPDLVLTVGDVNSTMATTLVAVKLGFKVAHVEAGLRSRDRTMPEEINRLVTDALADFLFTTSQDADENLRREGIADEKIFFVGNTMIDTLMKYRKTAQVLQAHRQFGLKSNNFALLTLHRPSNVDDHDVFRSILAALQKIQQEIPILFPIHPRTEKNIERFGFSADFNDMSNMHYIQPQNYLNFLSLMIHSRFVMTDSGGLQEESTVLGIPCLTLRKNTERPITITMGSNKLVGNDTEKIIAGAEQILDGQWQRSQIPPLWDGQAAERITNILVKSS